MKLIQKYGKKKIYIYCSILAVMCIIIGISTWYIMEQNYKQKVLDSIGITFIEEASIEYGTEKVDYNTYIKERTGEPEVQLPTEEINTKELGKKQVTYVLSKDGYSKTEILSVVVEDTKAPEIKLKEDKVSIIQDVVFEPSSNIESVSDVIDGDISLTTEDITKDGYFIKDDVDISAVGDYTVKIIAYDKNGNKAEMEYEVNVVKKDEVNKSSSEVPSGMQGNPNAIPTAPAKPDLNTGDSSNGSNNVTKPVTCPNGNEPFEADLPCDYIFGAWDQADPKIQFSTDEEAYNKGNELFKNEPYYTDRYSGFTTAPCYYNDGREFHVITPYK